MSRENTGFLSVGGAVRRRQLSLLTRNSLDNDVDDLCNGDNDNDNDNDNDDLYNGNDDERNCPDNNCRFKRGGTIGSACDVRASLRV